MGKELINRKTEAGEAAEEEVGREEAGAAAKSTLDVQ